MSFKKGFDLRWKKNEKYVEARALKRAGLVIALSFPWNFAVQFRPIEIRRNFAGGFPVIYGADLKLMNGGKLRMNT